MRLIPLSSLRPVTTLRLCCTSLFPPAGRMRILSVVYLSWTSFMCLIDPQSRETIDFSPLMREEVNGSRSCFQIWIFFIQTQSQQFVLAWHTHSEQTYAHTDRHRQTGRSQHNVYSCFSSMKRESIQFL